MLPFTFVQRVCGPQVENRVFAALSHAGVAPRYYGRFENGRVEAFLEGCESLALDDMARPEISRGVAVALAALHNWTPPPGLLPGGAQSKLWEELLEWLARARSRGAGGAAGLRARCGALQLDQIACDIEELRGSLDAMGAPVVFCRGLGNPCSCCFRCAFWVCRITEFGDYGFSVCVFWA